LATSSIDFIGALLSSPTTLIISIGRFRAKKHREKINKKIKPQVILDLKGFSKLFFNLCFERFFLKRTLFSFLFFLCFFEKNFTLPNTCF
jgi:hypothetical protein